MAAAAGHVIGHLLVHTVAEQASHGVIHGAKKFSGIEFKKNSYNVLLRNFFDAVNELDIAKMESIIKLSGELNISHRGFKRNLLCPLSYVISKMNTKEDYQKMFPIFSALRKHYDINDTLGGSSALSRAVRVNNFVLAQRLLFFGADSEQRLGSCCYRTNPLEDAQKLKDRRIAEEFEVYMQRRGRSQRSEPSVHSLPPWIFDNEFIQAIDSLDIDLMNRVLENGYNPDTRISIKIEGKSLLSTPWAILIRQKKHGIGSSEKINAIIDLLLKHGANPDRIIAGKRALEHAALFGDLEWVKGLLESGAKLFPVKTNSKEISSFLKDYAAQKRGLEQPLLSAVE